jgi:hypothetical protein
MRNILKLKQEIHNKTSMPVSKGQLMAFLKEYKQVNTDTLDNKCWELLKKDNFNSFTDFMVERTDIPLFK